MIDHAHYMRMRSQLFALLDSLPAGWPSDQLTVVREEVEHNEFAEALDLLLMIGARNQMSYTRNQVEAIESITSQMDFTSPSLDEFRKAPREGSF